MKTPQITKNIRWLESDQLGNNRSGNFPFMNVYLWVFIVEVRSWLQNIFCSKKHLVVCWQVECTRSSATLCQTTDTYHCCTRWGVLRS